MSTQTITRTLSVIECECGVTYGLTKEFIAARRESHKTFWCPNGCSRHWPGETDHEKAIARLEKQNRYFQERNRELLDDDAALTYDIRDAQQRAKKYSDTRAQKGAFWRGYTDRECGRETGCCPYSTNRFGFRRAWFDGFDVDYEAHTDTQEQR